MHELYGIDSSVYLRVILVAIVILIIMYFGIKLLLVPRLKHYSIDELTEKKKIISKLGMVMFVGFILYNLAHVFYPKLSILPLIIIGLVQGFTAMLDININKIIKQKESKVVSQ